MLLPSLRAAAPDPSVGAARRVVPPSPDKAVLRDITVYVEGWDTVLSGYVFDIVVRVPRMNSIWRFSEQSPEYLKLDITAGEIPCHDVPLLGGGFIVVECTSNVTGRMYQPSSSTDPYVENLLQWKLAAQTLSGSTATASSGTRATTDPQWNYTGSATIKESGKILGFGVELTQMGQIARQGQIDTTTIQLQRTITTPELTVYGCELHRVAGRPDLSLNSTRTTGAYA